MWRNARRFAPSSWSVIVGSKQPAKRQTAVSERGQVVGVQMRVLAHEPAAAIGSGEWRIPSEQRLEGMQHRDDQLATGAEHPTELADRHVQ